MKIGIIGGTGLIGGYLAEELHSNHEVVIFSRKKITNDKFETRQMVQPDIQSMHDLDVLINLAGDAIAGVRWTDHYKKRIIESRAGFTRSLVKELEKANHKMLLINSSAIGYYGSYPGETEDFTEESPAGNDFLGLLCEEWEKNAEMAKKNGHSVILLRTGIVLAREGGALPKMAFPVKTFLGGEIGSGRQIISWIHVLDLVRAIHFLIDNQGNGPFNLTAPQPVDNLEFTRQLGKILHRPTLIPVPAIILKLLFSEGAEVLLSGQKALPEKLLKKGFKFQFETLENALNDLLV